MAKEATTIEAAGREVRLSSPASRSSPTADPPITKLELAEYYVAVADAAVIHLRERPTTLKRFVDGAGGEFFFQKRVPKGAPDWLESATVHFPSGRSRHASSAPTTPPTSSGRSTSASSTSTRGRAGAPTSTAPTSSASTSTRRRRRAGTTSARWRSCARDVLADHDLVGFPKTSGNRGIHVNVRIEPEWDFDDVRRAALALAREVERRVPKLATSKWWKEERHGVFVDYNQNARDRTVASAYSVRPVPDARVSTPLDWDEVPDVDPGAFTLRTVPDRLRDARRPVGGHRRARRPPRCPARPRRAGRGRRPRRRPLAAPLPQAEGRAEAGPAEQGEEGIRAVRLAAGLLVELVDRAGGGSLSSRQRRIWAPWRIRPALTWSKLTSMTSSGRSETHSRSRSPAQRLGSAEPRSPVS